MAKGVRCCVTVVLLLLVCCVLEAHAHVDETWIRFQAAAQSVIGGVGDAPEHIQPGLLLIDTSGSISHRDMIVLKDALVTFVDRVWPKGVPLAVGSFSDEFILECHWASKEVAMTAIKDMTHQRGSTALMSALHNATQQLIGSESFGKRERASLILVTDGVPNDRQGALHLLNTLSQRWTRLMVVGFGSIDEETLSQMTAHRGEWVHLPDLGSLSRVASIMGESLKHKHMLRSTVDAFFDREVHVLHLNVTICNLDMMTGTPSTTSLSVSAVGKEHFIQSNTFKNIGRIEPTMCTTVAYHLETQSVWSEFFMNMPCHLKLHVWDPESESIDYALDQDTIEFALASMSSWFTDWKLPPHRVTPDTCDLAPPRILVVGPTGAGKTTFVSRFFNAMYFMGVHPIFNRICTPEEHTDTCTKHMDEEPFGAIDVGFPWATQPRFTLVDTWGFQADMPHRWSDDVVEGMFNGSLCSDVALEADSRRAQQGSVDHGWTPCEPRAAAPSAIIGLFPISNLEPSAVERMRHIVHKADQYGVPVFLGITYLPRASNVNIQAKELQQQIATPGGSMHTVLLEHDRSDEENRLKLSCYAARPVFSMIARVLQVIEELARKDPLRVQSHVNAGGALRSENVWWQHRLEPWFRRLAMAVCCTIGVCVEPLSLVLGLVVALVFVAIVVVKGCCCCGGGGGGGSKREAEPVCPNGDGTEDDNVGGDYGMEEEEDDEPIGGCDGGGDHGDGADDGAGGFGNDDVRYGSRTVFDSSGDESAEGV